MTYRFLGYVNIMSFLSVEIHFGLESQRVNYFLSHYFDRCHASIDIAEIAHIASQFAWKMHWYKKLATSEVSLCRST